MAEERTLSDQFRELATATPMARGNLGYGRSMSRKPGSILAEVAKAGPVDIHHYDDTTGKTTLETIQDVNPIIAANKIDLLSGHDGYSPSRELRKVASIPNIEIAKLYQRGINIFNRGDWPKIAALLDSQEWEAFRTAPGRISRRAVREYVTPRMRRQNRRRLRLVK